MNNAGIRDWGLGVRERHEFTRAARSGNMPLIPNPQSLIPCFHIADHSRPFAVAARLPRQIRSWRRKAAATEAQRQRQSMVAPPFILHLQNSSFLVLSGSDHLNPKTEHIPTRSD